MPRVKTERVSNGNRGIACELGTTEKPLSWGSSECRQNLGSPRENKGENSI